MITRKLGKLPVRHDPRTLKLSNYLPPTLPKIPQAVMWGQKVPKWGMMLNDRIGDCTCAAAGHLIQTWCANHHMLVVPTDQEILSAYEAVGRYSPSDPSTDQGAVELDVLNYWRQTGIAGHKILAYVSINTRNFDHLRAAIYLFGGIYTGFDLPLFAEAEVGKLWDIPLIHNANSVPGSWGGHAVPITDFSPGKFNCVTWGAVQTMSSDFLQAYCSEAYAIIGQDWASANKGAPCGFDLKSLQADLALVV